MAPIDAVHVRYAAPPRRCDGARIVMPDYPLAPEHTWRDSHEPWSPTPRAGPTRSRRRRAGRRLRRRRPGARDGAGHARPGLTPATHLVLHAPWVDLTTSTPETRQVDAVDPWLFYSKVEAYAGWWAGTPDDLGRPEVSPALADLAACRGRWCSTAPATCCSRLPAARAAGRRGRLGPDLRRGARPDPRLRPAPADPRGTSRLHPGRGVRPVVAHPWGGVAGQAHGPNRPSSGPGAPFDHGDGRAGV